MLPLTEFPQAIDRDVLSEIIASLEISVSTDSLFFHQHSMQIACLKRKQEKNTIPAFYYLFEQITWTSAHCSRAAGMQPAEVQQESIVSYLPLSHVAAQMYDLWTGIKWGEQVYFAEPDALKVSVFIASN